MSNKITPKQEKFCCLYVELDNASEAYRGAYSTKNMGENTIWREACRLLKNHKVATRITELRKHHAERHDVNVDSITTELEEARQLAKETESAAAMVTASMGKAKLHGIIIDKKEVTGAGGENISINVVFDD